MTPYNVMIKQKIRVHICICNLQCHVEYELKCYEVWCLFHFLRNWFRVHPNWRYRRSNLRPHYTKYGQYFQRAGPTQSGARQISRRVEIQAISKQAGH